MTSTRPADEGRPAAPADKARPRARLRSPAHRVSPRAMAHWAIDSLLAWGLIALVAWGAAAWAGSAAGWSGMPGWLADRLWWPPAAVTAVGLLVTAITPVWRYRVHRWEISADVVYTRTGWFSREWMLVPVSRIQTVDTEQGLVERLLGLATIEINTASHAGSSQVAGLPASLATRLAEQLAHRAHDLRDDAT